MVVQKRKLASAKKTKSKKQAKKLKKDEEVLSSDFDDDESVITDGGQIDNSKSLYSDNSSDEDETAQEKKLRLTKEYLDKLNTYSADVSDEEKDVIGEKLQEEVLEETGKLQKLIADTCNKPDDADIQHYNGHRLSVTAVVVSPDGKIIFSASKDSWIIKWDVESKKKLCIIKGGTKFSSKTNHCKVILALALSHSSKFLASAGKDENIHIWNAETCEHVHFFRGHRDAVCGLSFRHNTHMLFSASSDRTVKVWNLDVMGYVDTLFGHQNAVLACDSFVRERCATAGGTDGTMRVWKIPEESQLVFHGNNNASIECVRFINEDYFITGDDDAALCVWNVTKKKPIVAVKSAHQPREPASANKAWISAVGALPNSDLVATGACDGFIRVWKCTQKFIAVLPLFEIPVQGFINDLRISSNGLLVAAVGQEHRLGRWARVKSARNRVLIAKLF